MSDLVKLVVKRFPENRNMQLMGLRIPAAFHCSRCNARKRSKLVAVVAGDWNELLCDGCYGELLTKSEDDHQ